MTFISIFSPIFFCNFICILFVYIIFYLFPSFSLSSSIASIGQLLSASHKSHWDWIVLTRKMGCFLVAVKGVLQNVINVVREGRDDRDIGVAVRKSVMVFYFSYTCIESSYFLHAGITTGFRDNLEVWMGWWLWGRGHHG